MYEHVCMVNMVYTVCPISSYRQKNGIGVVCATPVSSKLFKKSQIVYNWLHCFFRGVESATLRTRLRRGRLCNSWFFGFGLTIWCLFWAWAAVWKNFEASILEVALRGRRVCNSCFGFGSSLFVVECCSKGEIFRMCFGAMMWFCFVSLHWPYFGQVSVGVVCTIPPFAPSSSWKRI